MALLLFLLSLSIFINKIQFDKNRSLKEENQNLKMKIDVMERVQKANQEFIDKTKLLQQQLNSKQRAIIDTSIVLSSDTCITPEFLQTMSVQQL